MPRLPPRIACLLVPDLPLRAELRAHPELAGAPLVIASGRGAQAQVLTASPPARARGVQLWSGLAQARAIAPDVVVRVASPALEAAARDSLLDAALSCAPRAELAPPGTGFFAAEGAVFVDARGTGRLFDSEAGFASALAARAETLGLPGAVGLTGHRALSLLVARRIAGGTVASQTGASETGAIQVLETGHESAWLAPLPIDLLDPDDRVAQALTRFGVRSVRDLLRLPRRGLTKRLGREVEELVRRARGEEADLPLPEPTQRLTSEGIDLEGAVHQLEPMRFVLRGLISRMTERLALRGLACDRLELELSLEGGARDVRHVSSSAPSLDVRVWLRLTMLALEEHPPGGPVEAVRIGCEGRPLPRDQLDLFRPSGPDPATLDRTLSELESICGEGRVGSPVVADSHLPTDFGVRPFGPRPPGDARADARGERAARLAVRALRPPVGANVRVERGEPTHVRSALTHGRVVDCSG
ncbi:MAG: DNA polymerase Y family protein, partial [Actinomycetota bacterium]|nr:DNA polymerase Y family protein [Actinomycetota bacterium]